MASCSRRKSESGARRDMISELPADVKERILECLDTRDAARTALLSNQWNDAWLRHGRLVFDRRFFECFSKCEYDKGIPLVNKIHDILLLRAGPVRKFTLCTYYLHPKPQQSDIDRWCCFLSRNGIQELDLVVSGEHKLPSCILSCRTIKQLSLGGFSFDLPINDRCIFPNVTSLVFRDVDFSDTVKGIVFSIPNLETLAFNGGKGIGNFEICSPKLESLSFIGYINEVESRWFMPHLKTIKALCLCADSLLCKNVEVDALVFPTAINLQAILLYDLSVSCRAQLNFVMQLLRKSPNVCMLSILATDVPCSSDDMEAASRLLEDPNRCIVKQDLKMLKTIKIETFSGSTLEMLFVKMLLSKSPALETFLIQEGEVIAPSMAVEIQRELLCFPRASPKAQIVCAEYSPEYGLVDYVYF